MVLNIGDSAPNFEVKNDRGEFVSSSGLLGKNFVLYFYPKDDTPGCTIEAKEFRDLRPEFDKLNCEIFGISKDDEKSHTKFKEKFCLPFALLADTDCEMCKNYGAWVQKSMFGKKYFGIDRITFLINESGKIAHIWQSVKPAGHASEVLGRLKVL